jgi:hypothetical protein
MSKKKLTKAEQIKLRDESYKPPVLNERRCEMCAGYYPHYGQTTGRCFAIEIRGEPQKKNVEAFGTCDLFQAKKPKSTEAKGK